LQRRPKRGNVATTIHWRKKAEMTKVQEFFETHKPLVYAFAVLGFFHSLTSGVELILGLAK
jgi:hypothetical protein